MYPVIVVSHNHRTTPSPPVGVGWEQKDLSSCEERHFSKPAFLLVIASFLERRIGPELKLFRVLFLLLNIVGVCGNYYYYYPLFFYFLLYLSYANHHHSLPPSRILVTLSSVGGVGKSPHNFIYICIYPLPYNFLNVLTELVCHHCRDLLNRHLAAVLPLVIVSHARHTPTPPPTPPLFFSLLYLLTS